MLTAISRPARTGYFLLSLIITTGIGAQVKVGLSAGGTSSGFNNLKPVTTTNTSNNYQADTKTGLNGGIKLSIPFGKSEIFNIVPELFINQNGNQDQYYTSFASFKDSLLANKVSLDYIGMYLPLKINLFNTTTKTGVYFCGAMYGDYTLNASAITNSGDKKELDFSTQKDRYDFGWRAAMGLMFAENCGLEIGYNQGISDIKFTAAQAVNKANYLINNHGFTVAFVASF